MPLAERLAVSACVGEQGLVAVDEYTIKSIQLIFGHFAFIRIAVVVSFLRSIKPKLSVNSVPFILRDKPCFS